MKPCLNSRPSLCNMEEIAETEIKEFISIIIEKKRQQLKEYNLLTHSIFHEMFGDSAGFEGSDDKKKQNYSEIIKSINKQKELIERSIELLKVAESPSLRVTK